MVRAKSPFGCSSSRRLRYCLTSRRYVNLSSSFPLPSTFAAYEYSSRACPSRSRPILASAMSSSSIGAWPHHSDSRCPTISASSARRSVYSTSGVSEISIDATAICSNLLALMLTPSLRGALATQQSSFLCAAPWIAPRSLSSGAHSRDPLARNDDHRFTYARLLPARRKMSDGDKSWIPPARTSCPSRLDQTP